jgi:hypothetical protein
MHMGWHAGWFSKAVTACTWTTAAGACVLYCVFQGVQLAEPICTHVLAHAQGLAPGLALALLQTTVASWHGRDTANRIGSKRGKLI